MYSHVHTPGHTVYCTVCSLTLIVYNHIIFVFVFQDDMYVCTAMSIPQATQYIVQYIIFVFVFQDDMYVCTAMSIPQATQYIVQYVVL